MHAEWERKCDGCDNQDVGLEAAIIERVRNSSLVESSCADNPTGLQSMPPKPRMRVIRDGAIRLVGVAW